jgi:hypothetical protein
MKNDSDWRVQSLRSFWQDVNWDNRPLITTIDNRQQVASSLSFTMSVREYFRAIAWTGVPAIAMTNTAAKAEAKAIPVDETKETLEDFLNDISSFF